MQERKQRERNRPLRRHRPGIAFVGHRTACDQNESVAERVRNISKQLKRGRDSLEPISVMSTDSLALANSSASNVSTDLGSFQNTGNHNHNNITKQLDPQQLIILQLIFFLFFFLFV